MTRFPFEYTRKEDRDVFDALWRSHSRYSDDILWLGGIISDALRQISGSYLSVHLRRGNFVSLGLLKGAEDIRVVKTTIQQQRQPVSEPFYVATNEQSAGMMAGLRSQGALLWADAAALPAVRHALAARPALAHILAFEDYVGLVEQVVCANARAFIGTRCSSFTGQILNLRMRNNGDRTFHYFPHRRE